MISIKRFLEQRRQEARPERDILEASLQMGRLLLEAVATHSIPGRDADYKAFSRTFNQLLKRLDEPPAALTFLEISSDAVEALDTYAARTNGYLRDQHEHLQSMIAMLTDTLAEITGESDASVARLQAIEQQIEHASRLDNMRALSDSLETCLAAVREAAAQQKKGSAATFKRLRDNITIAQTRLSGDAKTVAGKTSEIELEPEVVGDSQEIAPNTYVGVFKLQRAEHIAARFGAGAKQQMLTLVSDTLKSVLGSNDRLLRWKGTSFVMFLTSTATIHEIRVLLTEAVARMGQHYIEVGKKSALISVGVDWIVFPQSQCASLDAVFNEVDTFLAREKNCPVKVGI